MGKILLTGATGRLGSHLLAALLARKEKVRAVVRPGSKGSLPRGVERFEWDLSSAPLPNAAFGDVDRAIHAAGLVGGHPAQELMRHNATATRNFVSACPQSRVKKLVVASSISIYGEYKGQTVDEEFEPRTASPYGKSKLAAEDEVRRHHRAIPTALLRFGMIYGPGFEQGYFDVFRYIEKGKMRIFGNGKNRIPLVHIDDAVRALLLALDAPLISLREYNIVGEEQSTQEELLAMASAALGKPAPSHHSSLIFVQSASAIGSILAALGMPSPVKFDAENIRQLTLDRAYSGERAQRELGFSARVKLADSIKQMVFEYRKKTGKGA